MVAFPHSIAATLLRLVPLGLTIILVVYSFFANRYGWRRRGRPLPKYSAFGLIALVFVATLLVVQSIGAR